MFERDGILLAVSEYAGPADGETASVEWVRYRTVGDLTITGAVRSTRHRHRAGDRGDLRRHRLRTRRDPRRRPHFGRGHGGPQARGLLLMARQLLRITTAGSVDDGKSTLIGRLLHDTDSLPTRPSGGRHRRGGRRRPRRAVRRPARRARAGHHDRCGVPVLLDRSAQLHPRRHPRPRALHPQHVHRRVQRPRRGSPGRRRRRGAAADPPARPHRKTVGHQALRRDGEQVRPRRFRPRTRYDEVEDRAASGRGPTRRHRRDGDPDRRQTRRQRGAPVRPHAVVRRARPCSSTWRTSS